MEEMLKEIELYNDGENIVLKRDRSGDWFQMVYNYEATEGDHTSEELAWMQEDFEALYMEIQSETSDLIGLRYGPMGFCIDNTVVEEYLESKENR